MGREENFRVGGGERVILSRKFRGRGGGRVIFEHSRTIFFFDFRVIGGGGGWVEREILAEGGGGRVIFE